MASKTSTVRVFTRRTVLTTVLMGLAFGSAVPSATITQETQRAWEAAVQRAQGPLHGTTCDPDHLLWIDQHSQAKSQVASGRVLAQHAQHDNMLPVPSGLVHHWLGSVFLPHATVGDVLTALQDYNTYRDAFSPGVIQSKLVSRSGDEFAYHLKFVQHGFGINAGLAGDFRSRYVDIDGKSGYSVTSATHLVELADAGTMNEHELPLDESHGYLERLFSIVRYREGDGGVYLEVETLSLSRDLPGAVRWVVSPLIQRFSRQVMTETLEKLRNRVGENNSVALALKAVPTHSSSR